MTVDSVDVLPTLLSEGDVLADQGKDRHLSSQLRPGQNEQEVSMSWFRSKTAPLEEVQSPNRLEQTPKKSEPPSDPGPPTPSKPPLPVGVQTYLEHALQRIIASHGSPIDRRTMSFVRSRTERTIWEWFSIADAYPFHPYDQPRHRLSETVSQMETRSGKVLSEEEVYGWSKDWYMEVVRRENRAFDRAQLMPDVEAMLRVLHDSQERLRNTLEQIPHVLDGAREHDKHIGSILASMYEDPLPAVLRRLEEAVATPIDYACDDATPSVDEQSMYADFAERLRDNGFDETSVFDLVAQLSSLVQQSRQVLPKLTPGTATQFEARILLSFRKKETDAANERFMEEVERQQTAEREREQEETAGAAASVPQVDLQQVSAQLTSINATLSNQAHDVARIKWFDIIDGLLGH